MTKDVQKKSLMAKAKSAFAMLCRTGFSSIFITNIIIKGVGLIGNVILVRLLDPGEYGSYTHIMNAYAILVLLADLGNGMTSVQLCSEYHEDAEKQSALFSMAFRRSMLISSVSSLLLLCSGFFYPFNIENAAFYTASLFLLPLIENVNRFLLNNAQIKLQNNVYAKINMFSSLIRYFVLLPLSYLFSFQGALYSEYCIQLLMMCFGLFVSRKFLRLRAPEKCLEPSLKRIFTRLSLSSALNNMINNSFSLIDVFLIGLIVKDMEILASYKVATTIPLSLAIIPSAIDIYIMPHFARHRKDLKWVKKTYAVVLLALCAFNLLVCLGASLLAPQIMGLLFGANYQNAGTCFAILLAGYFFSAIRLVTYTVLYTQRQVNVNVILTCISLGTNVLFNVLLIPKFQSIGAALASAGVNLLSAVLMVGYLIFHLWRISKHPPEEQDELPAKQEAVKE